MSALGLAALLALAAPPPGPRVIVFGGGRDPAATPVSVEAHVLALAKSLARAEPLVLFNEGTPTLRSVQVLDERADPAGYYLARLLDHGTSAVGVSYRASKVAGARAATANAVLEAIASAARESPRGAVIFGAGHGRGADGETPAALELWDGGTLGAKELAARVDAERPRGPIALVLGHCYSGALSSWMYGGAAQGLGLARAGRCVLAAAPPDRTASGCTADADDPDARAYLALVADALAGAPGADLDGNGRVSIGEAHAHAVMNDGTVDLPIKSSEEWTRAMLGEEEPSLPPAAVRAGARADARAILAKLGPSWTPKTAHARLEELEARIDALDKELRPLEDDRDDRLDAMEHQLLLRWPELASPYQRGARALLGQEADRLLEAIEAMPEAKLLAELDGKILRLEDARGALEREAVRVERWLRSYQGAARELALRKRGDKATLADLDRLIACESLEP